jgi:hypothetical protein
MEYRFLLRRGQFVTLIVVLIVGGALTYFAGMLTGIWVERRSVAETEIAAEGEAAEDAGVDGESEDPGQPADGPDSEDELSLPPERIYELQMNAYLTQEEALPDVERLAAAGYQAYVVESLDSQNRSLFTVRIGPWSSMEEAARASGSFIEHSGIEDMQPVIRHRPRPAANGMAPVNGVAADGH